MENSPHLTSLKKVVWAIDPFADPSAGNAMRPILLELIRTSEARIVPVFVLSTAAVNLTSEISAPWLREYRPEAENALREFVANLRDEAGASSAPRIDDGIVLEQPTDSKAGAVQALAQFAEAIPADLIVVATHRHGRGLAGWNHWLTGSFVETLMLETHVPVLSVGPTTPIRGERGYAIDHILFPTDFDAHAPEAFRTVVGMAKELGARITIFHAISRPIEPVFQSGVYLLGGSWIPPMPIYLGPDVERQRRHAELWAAWAEGQGVATELVIETQHESIAQSVLHLADSRGASLIAMQAQSGRWAAALLGSITRQVVRAADCPVWVMRLPAANAVRAPRRASASRVA